ncbi:hypothetical protein HRI_004620400 [Hibiscus trionum]|uniref:Endonuclease/exonuclease/phosphatase domain-containing protein n=1 Tax=Hibiscus trionum TaxID=183268 RepID=A0A9W7JAA3_HIBTR|nr:hypothetical protein HRI_004620400 [Hibiscus trionum]
MNQKICITWNVRGLGSLEKKASTKRLIRCSKTSVLFIEETKIQKCDDWVIRQIVGSNGNFIWAFAPAVGLSGGLLSIWDPEVFECQTQVIQRNYIILIGCLTMQHIKLQCTLINVYGPNGVTERRMVFNDLCETLSNLQFPILMGGDFNIVCRREEKLGASERKGEMKDFGNFINSL